MARGVGVEIGDQRVRVAHVENTAKKLRLLSYTEQPIQPGEKRTWADAAADALRVAFGVSKAPKGRIAASLDSGDAVLRELTLPFKADDQIKKTYRFELESLIHNYSIEDLICDYFKVGETDKGATILAAAVPRKVVDQRLGVFRTAGLDPAFLDLDVTALFNTVSRVGAVDTDEPFLIVYGTARFTKIILVEKRRPRSMRTIRFSFPTKELAELEQAERRQAREWQSKDLDKPAPIVILTEHDSAKFADLDLEQRTGLIEILAKEISRFLLANAASAAPSHILLAGEYEVEEAAAMLEAGTQIPVKPLQIMDRIEHSLARADADAAAMRAPVAIGLALKACEADELGLDFRRHEFSYSKKYDSLKTTALVTLELVIVLLAAVALHFHFLGQDLEVSCRSGDAEHPGMMELQARVYRDALGEDPADVETAYEDMIAKHKEWSARFGGGGHPLQRSALDLANRVFVALYEFQREHQTKKLGNQELYYLIERVSVSQQVLERESVTIEVRGTISNVQYAAALITRLRQTDPFTDAAWQIPAPNYDRTPDGKQTFTLRVTRTRKPS